MFSSGTRIFLLALKMSPRFDGKRIEIAQMQMAYFAALARCAFSAAGNRTRRRAPGDDKQITFEIPRRQHVGDFLSDRRDLRRADAHHVFVFSGS